MSRRGWYRHSRSDPLAEGITSIVGAILILCIFGYVFWVMLQPGAFNFNFIAAPTPTRLPSQSQMPTLATPIVLLISLCAVLVGGTGLVGIGLFLWRKSTKHSSPTLSQNRQLPTAVENTPWIPLNPSTENPTSIIGTNSSSSSKLESSTESSRQIPLSVTPTSPMSNAERTFFAFLEKAVKDDYQIFPQMPLNKLVKRKGMLPTNYYTMLENGSVDFVLAHAKYLNPILAVELDDSSHSQTTTKARDQVKEALLKEARIPLLRFRVGDQWDSREIRRKIDAAILR